MAMRWTLGCDAADPQSLAAFWAQALGYVPEPGYAEPDGASTDSGVDQIVKRAPGPKTPTTTGSPTAGSG